jgi:hypothetical protein
LPNRKPGGILTSGCLSDFGFFIAPPTIRLSQRFSQIHPSLNFRRQNTDK